MFITKEHYKEMVERNRNMLEAERRMLDLAEGVHKDNKMLIDLCKQLLDENKTLIAEIERLNKANKRFAEEFDSYYALVKSNAMKEFAEMLKDIYTNDERYDRPNAHTLIGKLFDNIDSLVEKMCGKENSNEG